MTAQEVKYAVASYLRYQRQCQIVSFERGPDFGFECPDVMAVTDDMRLLEVEVKVSLSDFKADAKKRKWKPWYIDHRQARTFFYAVPAALEDRVKPLLRTDAGLIVVYSTSGGQGSVGVSIKARRSAERIGMRLFMEMVRHQTGTMIGMARDLAKAQRRLLEVANAEERRVT